MKSLLSVTPDTKAEEKEVSGETLAIRGLSVGVGIRRIVGREALTGLSVGVMLGVVMLPVVAAVAPAPTSKEAMSASCTTTSPSSNTG